uniref:Integrase core domain containing protein n=1 Tax=Solanum tuberosum TaxID=4113 RepID=M1DKC6_SOLTU
MPHRRTSEYPREGEVHAGGTTTTELVEVTHISTFALADSTPDFGGFQTEMATLRVGVDALAASTASAPDPSPTEVGDEVLAALYGDVDTPRALRKRTLTFDDTIDGAEDWCTKNKERHKFEASQ